MDPPTEPPMSKDAQSASTNHVYIWDAADSWIPAQVIDRPTPTTATVLITATRQTRTIDLNDYPNHALPMQNVDGNGQLSIVEDMVDLSFLHEAAILYNLQARHVQSLPYTRTGDIVIAVNPYRWFTDLYSPTTRQSYGQALVWNSSKEDPRHQLRPHVYEASSLAYRGLLRDAQDQSILVSGESGAGKTETVKILLSDLASVQRGPQVLEVAQDHDTVRKVLDSNPLLEAFGNAQTLRNDNSSRFGKYLQLQFDRSSESRCVLAGSKCEVYLLEKSRVTLHHVDERTYHVFYQLLAAPEDVKQDIWSGLADTDTESFEYVGAAATDVIEGKTDAERFQLTTQALQLVGVQGESLRTLWRAICIVLQLGNLDFEAATDAAGVEHMDASQIADEEELQSLSELMGVPAEQLTKALTIRNVAARSETFQVPLTPEKAQESKDAFAKEIYAKTFLWLVRTINDATCAEQNYTPETPVQRYGIIGLLDIFGFETFEVNRFEQLCINYANEKLQQKFTQDIFRSVQLEYEMEGIELEEITYDDNRDVLDLVEGRMGLLAFLNEECVRPKGSDKTFVYKAHAMNKENPYFFRDRHALDCEFGIHHYAGKVTYDATNFVVKNMDTLPSDLQDCASFSTNDIVAKELTNDAMMNPSPTTNAATVTASTTTPSTGTKKRRRPKAKPAAAAPAPSAPTQTKKRSSNLVAETVWTKFKNQLNSLMESLSDTKTRYIRCIKPNTQKKPLLMDHSSTVEQLRCAGVVAAVTISRSAFPNRLEHYVVVERFKALWPKGEPFTTLHDNTLDVMERSQRATDELLTVALKKMEFTKNGAPYRAFVMGRTRAYFRAGALEFLEGERIKHLGTYATMLQAQVRGMWDRFRYRTFRTATILIQAGYRRKKQYRAYQVLRSTSIRVQCWCRVLAACRTIVHLRRTFRATQIQTRFRILRDQRRFRRQLAASVVVQAMVRGALQRPKYRQALFDKKEEAKLENKLLSLQRKLEEAESKRVEAEKEAEARAKAAIEQVKVQEQEKAARREQELESERAKAAQEEEERRQKREEEEHQRREKEEQQEALEREHHMQEEQHQLMDESGKMLEHMHKEIFKLRAQNKQLKRDFDLLKDNSQRLMDANASAGASFAALNQHAIQVSKQNTQLLNEVRSFKSEIHNLNMLQAELKDELKMKQTTYVSEVHSRLLYQKALQKITDIVQEQCKDHRLVEKTLQVADEVEMQCMSMGDQPMPPPDAGIDDGAASGSHNHGSRSSLFGYLNFFSSS